MPEAHKASRRICSLAGLPLHQFVHIGFVHLGKSSRLTRNARLQAVETSPALPSGGPQPKPVSLPTNNKKHDASRSNRDPKSCQRNRLLIRPHRHFAINCRLRLLLSALPLPSFFVRHRGARIASHRAFPLRPSPTCPSPRTEDRPHCTVIRKRP